MKLGLIISMYDEIDMVQSTITNLKDECKIITIQSNPQNEKELLNDGLVDYYKLLDDVAGTKDDYLQEQKEQLDVEWKDVKIMKTPARALTRNWRKAFAASKNFDVDWWICILGDVHISNLAGIKKIIQKMEHLDKNFGFTRAVGLRAPQEFYGTMYLRTQRYNTTDFFPQFFVVNSKLIKQGLFQNIKIISSFEVSVLLGEHVKEFCKNNNLNFWDICYSISDHPYPKSINGLHYNPDRVTLPRILLNPFNWLRRLRMRLFFSKKDDLPSKPKNFKDWENDANSF